MAKIKPEDVEFYRGVITALAVMKVHNQDTIFDEIVEQCGDNDLVQVARRDGALKWSGISGYLKRKKASETE